MNADRTIRTNAAGKRAAAIRDAKPEPTVTVHLKYAGTYEVRINGANFGADYAAAQAFAAKLGLPRTRDTSETWD